MKSKLIAVLLPLLGAASVLAQSAVVPALLSYQGRVTDSAGNLVGASTPVNRAVKFQLYTASSGGTAIWAETQTVTISGGEFSVLVGNGTGISGLTGPSAPAPTPYKTLKDVLNSATTSAFYLGVTVDDGNSATVDAEISPRQQLVSGAFALRAAVAESVASSAVTTAMVADSSITTGKIADANVTSAKIADGTVAAADIAANAITAAKIDSSSVGLWSVSGASVYRAAGNVGVGTASPSAPLHVLANSNTDPSANGLYVQNTTNAAGNNAIVGVRTGGTSAGNPFYAMEVSGIGGWSIGLDNADGQKLKFSSNSVSVSSGAKMTLTSGGNLGVGTTTPGFPLTFADALGDKISLYGQSGSHYGFGIQNNLLQVHSATASDDIAFGYGSSYNFTERMRVRGNGYVGIGTSSPSQKLTIDSGWLAVNAADGAEYGISGTMAGSDSWAIYGSGSGNNGSLVIRTYDDSNEPINFIQTNTYRGGFNSAGNFELNNVVYQINSTFNGAVSYAQMQWDTTNGAINFNVFNSWQSRNAWRTVRYDGDSNWDYFSDRRLKKDIIDAEPMLDRLMQVRFRRFHWLTSEQNDKLEFGVIAQEVEPLFPEIVGEGSAPGETEIRKTVGYTEFATIAAKSIQELKARNDAEFSALRNEISEKDARIADLEKRLAALEKLLTPAK